MNSASLFTVALGLQIPWVPPSDIAALRTAIEALLSDPERRRRLGAGGLTLMAREFSIVTMVDGNLAVYRDLSREAALCAEPG